MSKKNKPKIKTISKADPNLQEGVRQHDRVQRTVGGLLVVFGLLSLVAPFTRNEFHPTAGLPFIAIGLFCWLWREPALLPSVAALFLTSIVPTIARSLTIPAPDPIVLLTFPAFDPAASFFENNGLEIIALVIVKAVMGLSAVQQFFQFRLLYGTEYMTGAENNLDLIPQLVPNRTDTLARWGRSVGVIGLIVAVGAVLFVFVDPTALGTRIAAETGGALGIVAAGLGFGAAFSPTTERRAALIAMATGVVAYITTIVTMMVGQ